MTSHSSRPRVPAWKLGFAATAAAAITIAASPSPAPLPHSTGISGYSGEFGFNCNICHFGGTTPTVTLLGPRYVLLNSTRTYSFVVSGGQRVAAGLDVSVNAGSLNATDSGTYINSGEVTHNAPRNVDSNGDAAWSFDFVAPAASGSMTMYASGNSVNLSGTTAGDRARSTTLAIDVVDNLTRFSEFGVGLAGSGGFVPHLFGIDGPSIGPWSIEIEGGLGGASGILWAGLGTLDQFPVFGGHFYVDLSQPFVPVTIVLGGTSGVPGAGTLSINGIDVSGLAPLTLYAQVMLLDGGAVRGISLSNAIEMDVEK
jgi:hypothetical protein